jgi:hypothetical protein
VPSGRRISENTIRLALGVALLVIALAFAVEALLG